MFMLKKRQIKAYLAIFIVMLGAIVLYLYLPKMFADEVYPLKYAGFIRTYSEKYGVDPALVAAVIFQESRFNPKAVSPVGAKGLMQFMPGTAATMAKETGRWPNYDIFDPETSVDFGAAHIRDLLRKYNGSIEQALVGYNAGTGTADSWIKRNIFEKIIHSNSSGETVNYVRKVTNYQNIYRTMYPRELGIFEKVELKQAAPADEEAKIRGFVWSKIFGNMFSF
jgi:soluble lytic murein transglycosylase